MGKDKQVGGGTGKKWSVFLAVLVLVAIIVVVIIVCIPGNTYDAVQTLNRMSQTSYLSSTSENVEFDKFKAKVGSSTISVYSQELNDIKTLSNKIDVVLDFYNDYLAFAKDNKTLQENYKDIRDGLNDAKSSQKRLENLVAETNKLSDNSSTYLQSAIVDFREEYLKYLKSSRRAIVGLSNVFNGSLGNTTFVNPATKLSLDVVNDYLFVIQSNFEKLIEEDIKGGSVTKYSQKYSELSLTSKIYCFNNFTLTINDEYYFDSDEKGEFDKIIEFYELYSEKNTRELINSIKGNSITKTYEGVTDIEGVLTAMCDYIV